MTRFVGRLADRLLSTVVPEVVARAAYQVRCKHGIADHF